MVSDREEQFWREMQQLNDRCEKEASKVAMRLSLPPEPIPDPEPTTRAFVHTQSFVKSQKDKEKNFVAEMQRLNDKAGSGIVDHYREFHDDWAAYDGPACDGPASDGSVSADSSEASKLRALVCEQALEISRLKKALASYKRKLHGATVQLHEANMLLSI